jgi:type 1 fimbriae regulatory protein FimB
MPRTLDKTVMVHDRYLVLLMFRHGLRISEDCGLGLFTTHPLRGDEIRAIKA